MVHVTVNFDDPPYWHPCIFFPRVCSFPNYNCLRDWYPCLSAREVGILYGASQRRLRTLQSVAAPSSDTSNESTIKILSLCLCSFKDPNPKGREGAFLLRPRPCDANANGLTMVMGDFNATLGETVQGVVGPHGLGRQTSDNGKRLVAFASANGLGITNTIFLDKQILQATWYPPDPRAKTSLKDYVLVKHRLRPSVLDTRVHRGGELDSDHRLVVVSLRLKLKRKGTHRPQKRFEVELLKQAERQADYVESIGKCFKDRRGEGSVERWKELQKAVVTLAEEHLHRKQPKQKWILEGTLEMIEEKRHWHFYVGSKIGRMWRSVRSMWTSAR